MSSIPTRSSSAATATTVSRTTRRRLIRLFIIPTASARRCCRCMGWCFGWWMLSADLPGSTRLLARHPGCITLARKNLTQRRKGNRKTNHESTKERKHERRKKKKRLWTKAFSARFGFVVSLFRVFVIAFFAALRLCVRFFPADVIQSLQVEPSRPLSARTPHAFHLDPSRRLPRPALRRRIGPGRARRHQHALSLPARRQREAYCLRLRRRSA